MVHFLYSFFDIYCFIILLLIVLQNKNIGQKQRYFKNYLILLCAFCLVDCYWGLLASHTIYSTEFSLKLASTLFYLFSILTSASWLMYMICYSGLINKTKSKTLFTVFVYFPVVILSAMLVINWNTGIIFSQFLGEYIRGQFQYVLITYILLYIYYFAALIIAIYISYVSKSEKHLAPAIFGFTIVPIITGILQLRHPDYPCHVIGFTLSAFIIFIFDIIDERDKVAADNLRAHQKAVLDRCAEIIGSSSSVNKNVSSLLKLIGTYYNATRVFIMEIHKSEDLADCTFEWCLNPDEAQIDMLKNIPVLSLTYWIKRFKAGNDEISVDAVDIEKEDYNLFRMCQLHKTNNIMCCALTSGGELFGFIGIDNPVKSTDNFRIIRTISVYVYSELLRRDNIINEQKTSGAVLTALAEDYSSVFYVNTETEEIRPYRYNAQMKKHFEKLFYSENSYSKIYEQYVNEVVFPDDREVLLKFGSIENLQKKLKYRKSVRKQYRSTINGKVEYFQAKWVKAEDSDSPLKGMIIGLANVDDQVRNNELIIEQKTTIEKQKDELTSVKEKAASDKRNGQIDRLTGLNNKIHGMHKMEKYVAEKDIDEKYVLMFIDIDHFKGFNDCYGHLVGDDVLIAVGDAIKSICRNDDIAIRFGGDEFVILIKNIGDTKVAMAKGMALKNSLQQYSMEKTYSLTCSIGMSISNYSNVTRAIEEADKALYDVKNTTRNDIKIYSEEKTEDNQ